MSLLESSIGERHEKLNLQSAHNMLALLCGGEKLLEMGKHGPCLTLCQQQAGVQQAQGLLLQRRERLFRAGQCAERVESAGCPGKIAISELETRLPGKDIRNHWQRRGIGLQTHNDR